MLVCGSMGRVLHIAVSVIMAVLPLRSVPCFASGVPRSHVAGCCLKGKCAPTTSSDAPCRNFVPDPLAPSKVARYASPLITVIAVYVPALAPRSTFPALADATRHPPPRIELTVPSLPLLV
jgi:hypothetical protein